MQFSFSLLFLATAFFFCLAIASPVSPNGETSQTLAARKKKPKHLECSLTSPKGRISCVASPAFTSVALYSYPPNSKHDITCFAVAKGTDCVEDNCTWFFNQGKDCYFFSGDVDCPADELKGCAPH